MKLAFGKHELAVELNDGNAFCIFFGPTPASLADEPRMASSGIALGKVVGGADVFRPLGGALRVRLLSQD